MFANAVSEADAATRPAEIAELRDAVAAALLRLDPKAACIVRAILRGVAIRQIAKRTGTTEWRVARK